MSMGTTWGLVWHYWVLFALTLTGISLVVLLLHMPTVTRIADVARSAADALPPRSGETSFIQRPAWRC